MLYQTDLFFKIDCKFSENLITKAEIGKQERGKIDLTQSLSVITISLNDVDMVKHLAKSNNIYLLSSFNNFKIIKTIKINLNIIKFININKISVSM
jgi:hypothetical protein